MQTQTRVIRNEFRQVVNEGVNDDDPLLYRQTKLVESAGLVVEEEDLIDLMISTRMETIIRDCIETERLGIKFSAYLEELINALAQIFEEVPDGTL